MFIFLDKIEKVIVPVVISLTDAESVDEIRTDSVMVCPQYLLLCLVVFKQGKFLLITEVLMVLRSNELNRALLLLYRKLIGMLS